MSSTIVPGGRHDARRSRANAGLVARWALAALTMGLFVGACSEDSTGTEPEEMVWPNDCAPYQPSQASGSFADTQWEAPNEHDVWQFTVPGDPGGGYVTVTLSAQHDDVVPWMNLDIVPAGGTTISSGAAAAGQQMITDVFEIAAGKGVEIEVFPWFNAPPEDHPVQYSLNWTYTSRVDCYEPNNGAPNDWPAPVATAKAIPIGEVVEATTIVGHDEAGPPSGPRLFDWYKFTLDAPRTLNVATVDVPDDVQAGLRIFAQDGSVFTDAPVPSAAGQTTETGTTTFPAGTWYIEFFPTSRGASVARTTAGEPIPPHFSSTYRLLISEQN